MQLLRTPPPRFKVEAFGPGRPDGGTAEATHAVLNLSESELAAVKTACRHYKTTMFTFLFAVFNETLTAALGVNDVLIG
ncbi:hypothetical protein ACSTJN_23440, partial [Vibrio parahaemolyticus]